MRTFDAIKIETAINHFLGPANKVDPIEWLSYPENIVLENEVGDLALFEYSFPIKKVYSGHYYFQSRGRAAITAGRGFLDELFNSCYNINIVMGLSPMEHKGARWISKQLGFTSYGTEELNDKQYELFIITKKEFNDE
jgi:hypothetical protein